MRNKILIVAIVFIQVVFFRITLLASNSAESTEDLIIKVNLEEQSIYIYDGNTLIANIPFEEGDTTLLNYVKNENLINSKIYKSISEREFRKLFPNINIDDKEQEESTYLDSSQSIINFFYKAVKSLTSTPY